MHELGFECATHRNETPFRDTLKGVICSQVGILLTSRNNVRLGMLAFLVISIAQIVTMNGMATGEAKSQADIGVTGSSVTSLLCALLALIYALHLAKSVLAQPCGNSKMQEIAAAIQEGSNAFLIREYTWLSVFVGVMTVILGIALNIYTAICFVLGALVSGGTGYLGMAIAVRGNVRTTAAAVVGLDPALRVAFNTGSVMGMMVVRACHPQTYSLHIS